MSEQRLPPFTYLPEHKDLFVGYFVRERNGAYHVQWRDPVTRRMKSLKAGYTYTEVVTFIMELKKKVSIGKPVVSTSAPFWQVVENWFEREVIPNKKPKTEKDYRYYCDRFLLPTFSESRYSDMTKPVLEEFFTRIDEFDTADPMRKRIANHGVVTVEQVNSLKKVTKSLFRWGCEEGYALSNAADDIVLEAVEPQERNIHTPEEFEFVLGFVNDYYKVHCLTLFWSSFRVGELAALPWNNIYFRPDGRVDIGITQGLSWKTITTPKTKKSVRKVTLPASVANALRQHQSRQQATQPPHPDNLVFTTTEGRTMDIGRFRERIWYKAQERANKYLVLQGMEPLPRVQVHGMRHSTITVFQNTDALPKGAVQQHAGHTNERTTSRYTHLEEQRRLAISDMIEHRRDEILNLTDEADG